MFNIRVNMFRELRVSPSRINLECIHGPRAYFDRVTEEVARELGIEQMPGPRAGNTLHADGVRMRRLKDGRLNITVEAAASILRSDPKFREFMSAVVSPQPLDPYPIYPTKTQIQATAEPPMNGVSSRWEFDLTQRRFVVPGSVAPLVRALDPHAITEMSEAEFYMGIDQAERVRVAFEDAVAGVAPLDVEYRRHGTPVRITGAVVRDTSGNAVRIVGVTAKATTQRLVA